MKIQIETLGCKVNSVEAESIAELFKSRGHQIVKSNAEVVIINTCCVTGEAESKSRQAIRKALKTGAEVAVMGCYGQLAPESLKEIGVLVVIGTAERHLIVDKIEEAISKSSKTNISNKFDLPSEFEELPHVPSKTRAFVKIQDGCNGQCTYCIIPKVRGKSRSRNLESIKRECKALDSYKEIVLTGIHLGMYGGDINLKLTDAIKMVLENTNARIRLSSIEPNEVTEDLISMLRDEPRICKHLHLPLQSGNDAVLEAMRRPYNTKIFRRIVTELKSEIPNITLGTDIILGFPTETAEMFDETFNLLQELPISHFHVFGYSPRQGTIAAEMKQVSPKEKKLRVNKILNLAADKNLLYRQSLIGNDAEILTERQKGDYIEGHSGEYIKVYMAAEDKLPLNEIVKVTLIDTFKDGMLGTII